MTSRRNFLKVSFAAAAVSMVTPFGVSASTPMYMGIIYTTENPGRWAKKAGSHAPVLEISGRNVRIITKHPMSMEHFIVRHTLVQEDGQVIGEKTFNPVEDKMAESAYELPPAYNGKVFATSFCNQHDFWMTEKLV